MDDFLKEFFPTVYHKKNEIKDNDPYCKYDNQGLQLFTSSLYLAGLIATFFASYTTRVFGRRPTMLLAGLFFLVGVVLNAAAKDLAMLIIGRILLGCGVGFANQVHTNGKLLILPFKVPVNCAEMDRNFHRFGMFWASEFGHKFLFCVFFVFLRFLILLFLFELLYRFHLGR